MSHFDDDEFHKEDYEGLDYNVLTRPEELIENQSQASTLRPSLKLKSDKSNSGTSKRTSDSKVLSKIKDKRSSSKHEKKERLLYKSPLSGDSPSKKSEVKSSKLYEALKKVKQKKLLQRVVAKSSPSKHKSEDPKTTEKEFDTNTKQPDRDTEKRSDIPLSKVTSEHTVTAMQKFQVLEARDNALRASMKPEGSKKVKIKGTCPDMCPEKERYSRIAKNCVSVLEMKTTFDQNATSHDADHRYMIKEYSRSSADQQEPLPHELRPISVLNLTMDYLICNIMDKSHYISLEEWYDFIWNRTRSIRKDITQQELCDLQSVEIIEKCVRFHIHCAEALSEEDAATFDPKINNENLTKCLQTLKHMYHDLQSKGIQCPNEAEFRSYDILLSLTEGETLRLIKDIRKDLLKSPLIKSAFDAALAFNSHNYVKFFKIMEKANYLSSCILHRYILEARIRALKILVRAYSTSHNITWYPTVNLVKDLKFENETEAAEFCKCHGLEADETFIVIDRRTFSKTASGLPVSRSFSLVGSKRNKSLGSIVNNGLIPANPKDAYQPHSSFDERNILKVNSLSCVAKEISENLIQVVEDKKVEEILPPDDIPKDISVSAIEKSSDSNFQAKDPSILELEKKRSELLEQLSKIEGKNIEKLNEKRNLLKRIEKSKSNKTTDSSSKTFKSVMFSENSGSKQVQNTMWNMPPKESVPVPENFFKQSVVSFGNDTSTSAATSFFKFGTVSPLKTFSQINVPDSSKLNLFQATIPNVSVFSKTLSTFTDQPAKPSSNFNIFSSQTTPKLDLYMKTNESILPEKSFVEKLDLNNQHGQDHVLKQSLSHPKFSLSEQEEIAVSPRPSDIFADETSDIPTIQKEMQENEVDDIDTLELMEYSLDKYSDTSAEDIADRRTGENIAERTTAENIAEKTTVENIAERTTVENNVESMTVEERKENELRKFVEEIGNQILFESVDECAFSICQEILDKEKELKALYDDSIEILRKELARKAIQRWLIFTQRRREKRLYENSAFFSPWQSMLLNTSLVPSGAVNPIVAYKRHCSFLKSTAEKAKKCKEVTPGWEKINPDLIWPLGTVSPYSTYSDSPYFGRSGIKNFFKICLIFPPCEDSDFILFMNWICAIFTLEKAQNSEFDYKKVFMLHNGKTVISVKALQLGPHMSSSYAKFLNGVTAMMLFIPKLLKDLNTFLENFISLRDSSVLDYPFPLNVYFVGSDEIPSNLTSFFTESIEDLSFTTFSLYQLSKINNFIGNSKKILEGLVWFNQTDKKARPPPILKKLSYRHYIEEAFAYVFNILLCKVSLEEFKFLQQEPQFIINFYNEVIKFRASALCEDLLKRIHSSWPPQEIKHLLGENFIDLEIQNLCKREMEGLMLPNFEGDPSSPNCSWAYARQVPSSSSNIVLSIKISDAHLNWIQKMIFCVEHLIQNNDFILLNGQNLFVYYTEEDLSNFECDQYWLNVLKRSLSPTKMSKRKNSYVVGSLKKQKIDPAEDITVFKVNKPVIQSSFTELHKEKIFSTESNASNCEVSFETVGNRRNSLEYSPQTLQVTDDWMDIKVKESTGNCLSSLADKISELQYNMNKNSILEDHFSQLLFKQI